MTAKVTLLRDVAKLLKKYKLTELSDAVSSLRKRAKSKSRPRPRARTTSKSAKKAGVTKPRRSPKARQRTKRPTSTEVESGKRNLAELSKRSGRVKAHFGAADTLRKTGPLERRRNLRADDLADALEDLSQSLGGARKSILEDQGEDYARWFRIISGDAGGAKPDDDAAKSASTEAEKSKEWKESIAHLRVQDVLLSGPFKLITSSPTNSRIITFLPDGAIGMGSTHLVARWRIFEGKLELLDAAGEVQSRFTMSNNGRLLTQILDPTAPFAGRSLLVRIAAKS